MPFGQLPEMVNASSAGPLSDVTSSNLPVSDERGHPVEIVGADIENLKDGKGQCVKLDYIVCDGPHKGAVGNERFNMYYNDPSREPAKNEQTRKIARESFFKVLHCIGLGFQPIQQLNVLSGRKFCVIVGLQKEPNPEKYTEIKAHTALDGSRPYLGPNGAAPAQQSQPQPQAQPQAQQGGWGQQSAPPAQQSAQQGGGWGQPQGQPAPQTQAQPQQQSGGGWGQAPAGGNGGWG